LNHCTNGLIATSSYYTTLEYDACVAIFSKFLNMPPRVWCMWRYDKVVGYIKNQFFGSFLKKMFQQRTRLSFDTFHALIRVVNPSLE
jgi:hypothetical protein